ncbi:MAG: protein kinase [Myxococcota bacterium]|nr:protein kinase [Myxococcota bacterium]
MERTHKDETAPTVPSDTSDVTAFEGDKVGRYLLLRQIGSGAMGRVFAGFDPELARRVAVKLVADGSHTLARYLRSEGRMLATLSHPNIVPVFDVGEEGDRAFIVMELVDGTSLSEWLEAAPRTRREIVRAWCDAGRGLAAAHAAGVIHRDFKASNVLIANDGHVRVADFGLARESDASTAHPVEGTRGYMAPEAFESGVATEAVDQYAFCVSLYHALTGVYPAANIERDRLPGRVRKVIERGLSMDPAARWPSMSVVVTELERAMRLPRVVWVAAAVMLVAALGGVGLWLARREEAGACEIAGDLVARELPVATRTRLFDAMRQVPGPHAAELASRVESLLGGALGAWSSAYEQGCHSPARARCLQSRLAELGAIIADAVAEQDDALLDVAIQLSRWTGELPSCATQTTVVDESREYQHAMARSLVLSRLGRGTEAIAAAERAVAAARDPRAKLRAQIRRFDLDPSTKIDRYVQLATDAQALGDDDLLAKLALAAVETCLRETVPTCAQEWLDRSGAAIARMPVETTAELRAKLSGMRGDVAARDGNVTTAAAMYQDELRGIEAVRGDKAFDLLPPLSGLANVLITLRRYDEAVAYAQRADAIAVHWLGEHHPFRATALAQLGAAKIKKGETQAGIIELERALALRIQFEGEDSPKLASMYNNLAAAYHQKNNLTSALTLVDRALALYVKSASGEEGRQLQMMRNGATLAGLLSRPDARARIDAAIALAKTRLPESHPDWAQLYQTRGTIALRTNDLVTADAALAEAATRLEALGDRAQTEHALVRGFQTLLAIKRRQPIVAAQHLERAQKLAVAITPERRAWIQLLAVQLALVRNDDKRAREQLAELAPFLENASDPRLLALYHMLAAELAKRARDTLTASTEKQRALDALHAAEIAADAIYQDCVVCTPTIPGK